MENSSKALLMAGGILMGILLLSGLALAWGRISNMQAKLDDPEKEAQIAEFNKQFSTYEGETIYGADIISLIHKIESVNKDVPEIFNSKVQYEEIKVSIDFISQNVNNYYKNLGVRNQRYDDITSITEFNQNCKNYIKLEEELRKRQS